MASVRCPCGGDSYETCCAPYHRGAEPPDAVSLMRSRYSAFVKQDAAYLYRTLHPDHDDRVKSASEFITELRRHFASRVTYVGLTILGSTEPDAEGIATVTFRVSVKQKGKDASYTERSLFARDASGWRYLAGSQS